MKMKLIFDYDEFKEMINEFDKNFEEAKLKAGDNGLENIKLSYSRKGFVDFYCALINKAKFEVGDDNE